MALQALPPRLKPASTYQAGLSSIIPIRLPVVSRTPGRDRRRGQLIRLTVRSATTNESAVLYADRTAQYLEEADTFSQNSGYIAYYAGSQDEQWREYDAEVMGKYFRRKPVLVARRLTQIGLVLGTWLGKRWLDAKTGRSEEMFQTRASELRQVLVSLGPAFVKIAQAVSSRPDVIPPIYLDELAMLQDRIAPFSTRDAIEIIEDELGVPVSEVFSEISPTPVAAASLGQVYEARLRSSNLAVAVKVQRPGVRSAIALDIFILRAMAGAFRKARRLNTDLQSVVDEWATSLFKEMDYEAEARNGIRFRHLFGSLPQVVVPRMYPELTTQRVLVMEWVEGTRLVDAKDVDLVEIGTYCSLSQLLESGFYHADPHPGNLLRTTEGKLAYLDFGMMGQMPQVTREALIRAAVHLVNREFDALAKDFVTLGLIPPGQEVGEVSAALTGVFQNAVSSGVRNLRFGSLGAQLGQTMYRFQFRIPAYFSLVVRSLSVLEGIALQGDPNFKILSASYPWIARKVLTDSSPELRQTLKALLYKKGRFRVDRLESLVSESTFSSWENSTLKEAPVKLDGRGKVRRILKFGLSPEASFLREVLLDEVAKGLDALSRSQVEDSYDALRASLPPPWNLVLPPPAPSDLTDDDLEHLDNLRRLAALFSLLQPQQEGQGGISSTSGSGGNAGGGGSGSGGGSGGPLSLADMQLAIGQLQGTVKSLSMLGVFTELPIPAQQTALLLPSDLASRIFQRVLARSIRNSALISSSSQQVTVGL